ncbi:MAG TPA: OstA-like protein [Bacteroidia bacterium]|nr:OstA-like protein [Bacteroidia bacterium]
MFNTVHGVKIETSLTVKRSALLLSALLFFCISLSAQQPKPKGSQVKTGPGTKINLKHADRLIGDKSKGYQRLLGAVQFEHEGMNMTCDSAHFFLELNRLDAYGHVFIQQGDSLRMWSDFLTYDGNTRIAVASKNVRLIEGDMTLTCDAITYDLANKFAYYTTGGKIVNKDNVLTSQNGGYSSESKTLTFKHNVVLKNPQYEMRCDTLRYTPGTRVAYFLGPTNIKSTTNTNFIYCENGFYDTNNDIAQFEENAFIVTRNQTLRGDSIWYDRKNGVGKAFKNIEIKDTTQKVTIHGDYAIHYENTETSLITGNAMLIQEFDTDSLYMHADTLKSITIRKKDEKGNPIYEDSLTEKTVLGYHNVSFFKEDMQGKCDSLAWSSADSTMHMFGNPVLWSEASQLTATYIDLVISNGDLIRLEMKDNCFIISQEDSIRYNQIKGRKMTGYFADNILRKIYVEGNGQTLYYARSENKLIGINRADCSKLMIWINEEKVESISFYSQPDAQLYPPGELSPSEALLKDFEWRGKERPEKVEDLLLK